MNKNLYHFEWYCGRQGMVESLFLATEEMVDWIIGKEVNFGEVLGKHSEIYGEIEEKEITKINISNDSIKEIGFELDSDTWIGYNPFEYVSVEYDCPECGYLIEGHNINFDTFEAKCFNCQNKINIKEDDNNGN